MISTFGVVDSDGDVTSKSTFTDGAPVVGEEPSAPGFWWLVGQAGAGIKTAPAMAGLIAALIQGAAIPTDFSTRCSVADVSPLRFRTPG